MKTRQTTRVTMAWFRFFGISGVFLINDERGFNHGLIEGGELLGNYSVSRELNRSGQMWKIKGLRIWEFYILDQINGGIW